MTVGLVFDIKEFAVHDGPGIRTTVFMKGCPLRCEWCHNPEGIASRPEPAYVAATCIQCGACVEVCESGPAPMITPGCTACGRCVAVCPTGSRAIVGEWYEASVLSQRVLRHAGILGSSGGGVTFSGGEPLSQWRFVEEAAQWLKPLHITVDTCGQANRDDFRAMLAVADFVLFDVKHPDAATHERYTGVHNGAIMRNLDVLCDGRVPFSVRIPLIPGVNDTEEVAIRVARRIHGAHALRGVDLLPYHRTAGAKHGKMGRRYEPSFDTEAAPVAHQEVFAEYGIRTRIL